MSTPEEQARALVWAGGLLVQISRDRSLPLDLRRQATVIARHFPTVEDIGHLATQSASFVKGVGRLSQEELEISCNDLKHGPLTDGTRLRWPE